MYDRKVVEISLEAAGADANAPGAADVQTLRRLNFPEERARRVQGALRGVGVASGGARVVGEGGVEGD